MVTKVTEQTLCTVTLVIKQNYDVGLSDYDNLVQNPHTHVRWIIYVTSHNFLIIHKNSSSLCPI